MNKERIKQIAYYLKKRGATQHEIGMYLALMKKYNPESMFRSFRKRSCKKK